MQRLCSCCLHLEPPKRWWSLPERIPFFVSCECFQGENLACSRSINSQHQDHWGRPNLWLLLDIWYVMDCFGGLCYVIVMLYLMHWWRSLWISFKGINESPLNQSWWPAGVYHAEILTGTHQKPSCQEFVQRTLHGIYASAYRKLENGTQVAIHALCKATVEGASVRMELEKAELELGWKTQWKYVTYWRIGWAWLEIGGTKESLQSM